MIYIQALVIALLYICLSVKFSQGFDAKDRRKIIISGLVIFSLAYAEQRLFSLQMFDVAWIPAMLVGLLWSWGNAAVKYYGNRFNPGMTLGYEYSRVNSSRDVKAGVVFFLHSVLLQCAVIEYMSLGGERIAYILLLVWYLLCSSLPIIELYHFMLYGKGLDENSISAVQATTIREASEYLRAFIGLKKGAFILLAFIILNSLYVYFISRTTSAYYDLSSSLAVCCGLLAGGAAIFAILRRHSVVVRWNNVREQRKEVALYSENVKQNTDALKVLGDNLISKGTILLVIGESEARDQMKLYNPSVPYDNTPWRQSMLEDDSFVFMSNVYAPYAQTEQSLKCVLTSMSQYNDIRFSEAISIVDVARKAGYKTYWFTNNGGIKQELSPINAIAKNSDVLKEPADKKAATYDKELINLLGEVDPEEKNLVILHIMGSHAYYPNRYPQEEAVFPGDSVEATYANTVLYTDGFLRDAFTYAKNKLGLLTMVYFSDHGENLLLGHQAGLYSFDTVRIPMFMYLSPDYRKLYPKQAAMLLSRKEAFYSTDMFYNTFSGMLGLESSQYDEKEDLSSSQYAFNRDNVYTFLHEIPVSADDT